MRTALVVSDPVDYGVLRMFEVYAHESAPAERLVTTDMQEAKTWIRQV